MSVEGFQRVLLDAVDDAFSSLGESAKQAIYFHLETRFKVKKAQIPCHLEDFENALESIFGVGTKFLEIIIMKKLYESIEPKGKALKWNATKEFRFSEYVKTAQETFFKRQRRGLELRHVRRR